MCIGMPVRQIHRVRLDLVRDRVDHIPVQTSHSIDIVAFLLTVQSVRSVKMSSSPVPSGVPAPAAEDLSRMEGEYGAKMIGKLKQQHVLIIGLSGVGVETAKNILLAGPHTVTLHDDSIAAVEDLGCNFYLTESSVGRHKAETLMQPLGELNPNVALKLHKGAIDAALLQAHDVVVVCDGLKTAQSFDALTQWNQICRTNRRHGTDVCTAFVYCAMSGVVAHMFSDFGPSHACFDADGQALRTIIVDHISTDKHAVVTVDGDRHLLHSGDQVKFDEIQGMHPLNEDLNSSSVMTDTESDQFGHDDVVSNMNAIHTIATTKNPKKFTIGDTTQLSAYIRGGVGVQIKAQLIVKHQSLRVQLTDPAFCSGYMDFTKLGRETQLHVAMLAAEAFRTQNKRELKLHSADDALKLVEIAKTIVKQQQLNHASDKASFWHDLQVDESLLKQYALYAPVELSPLCALFGGIVAQELTKQCGKYTPVTQWLHFDAFELLKDSVPTDAAVVKADRYTHLTSVFGSAFVQRLQQQRVFLVGCGALGCEYLKLFALLGLGCGGDARRQGSVTLTDDDRIELSNLSRQFLFRRKHVGSAKSVSAAQAVQTMNPALSGQHLHALETRVEPKTESTFDDVFWNDLDFVVNALDNAQARNYVDSKCVLHLKPLFESGTLGTQANSVVCLPKLTPSYREGAVAGEEQGIAKVC